MVSPYKSELDQIVWSFSTLHLYETCPYAFYLYKIERRDGTSNFYAENGKAMHTIFQLLEEGKITLEKAPAKYLDEYDSIDTYTREGTMKKTFDTCLDYLCTCDEAYKSQYEIIWVERRVSFKIGRRSFTGFVDLLLKDRITGQLILIDHKSNDPFFKKNSSDILKNQQEHFEAYSHQMYLYCYGIYQEFGVFPSKIVWHHFKHNGALSVIDFNKDNYLETLDWAKSLVSKIYRDKKFSAKMSYIYCRELCNYRVDCEYRGLTGGGSISTN